MVHIDPPGSPQTAEPSGAPEAAEPSGARETAAAPSGAPPIAVPAAIAPNAVDPWAHTDPLITNEATGRFGLDPDAPLPGRSLLEVLGGSEPSTDIRFSWSSVASWLGRPVSWSSVAGWLGRPFSAKRPGLAGLPRWRLIGGFASLTAATVLAAVLVVRLTIGGDPPGEGEPYAIWSSAPAAAARVITAPAGVTIVSASSGRCLTGGDVGAVVLVIACDQVRGAEQRWQLLSDSSLRSQGRCVDVESGDVAAGARLVMATCAGTVTQRWRIGAIDDLISVPAQLCVGAPVAALTDSAAATLNACDGTPFRSWFRK